MDEQTPSVSSSHVTQYVGIFIVGVLVGAGAMFSFKQLIGDSYEVGFSAAKKRVEGSSLGAMLLNQNDTRSIFGVITAVSGNRVTIHTQPQDPFQDPALDDRVILVTKDTKIYRLSQKDIQALEKEAEELTKKVGNSKQGAQLVSPPNPFMRTLSTIADVVVGQTVTVTAEENIKTMKEFSASEIQIQSK